MKNQTHPTPGGIESAHPGVYAGMLAGILDIVADAVIAVDREQRIIFFNRGAERILGWQASEITGLSLHEILPERSGPIHDARMRAFARSPQNARLMGERQEVFGRRKDGREFPAEVSIAKIGEGKHLYFMAILRDITDRAQHEDALQASSAQLKALSRKLVEALEEERRTIGRNLHDEAGQGLTALQLQLKALELDPQATPDMVDRIHSIKQIVEGIQQGLHALAANLRPAALDRIGLVAALGQYAESFGQQSGLQLSFAARDMGEIRLSSDAETALYRIAQEALTNIARHAQATAAGVILQAGGGSVLLIIDDNGVGFDTEAALRIDALGLAGMRERAEGLGGSVTIESIAGSGTTVYVSLPA
ncbi:MAG TPA: PAS domain-containing sensor histidine kinase [Anaerolineae bacterium]